MPKERDFPSLTSFVPRTSQLSVPMHSHPGTEASPLESSGNKFKMMWRELVGKLASLDFSWIMQSNTYTNRSIFEYMICMSTVGLSKKETYREIFIIIQYMFYSWGYNIYFIPKTTVCDQNNIHLCHHLFKQQSKFQTTNIFLCIYIFFLQYYFFIL